MKFNGFVGGMYKMDAEQFDCQRCINLYPLASEVGTSKEPSALRAIPGYELYATAGGGPIRNALTTSNGRGWVVSGYKLYEVTGANATTERGTLLTGTNRVSMAENGTQLMIVDGQYGYIYNMDTETFAQILDADFPVCQSVTFQDGYFIVQETGTPKYYISALYDGTSWDALDFGRADTNPDNLTAVLSDHSNLWLAGDRSIEVHTDTGNVDFPFELIPGAVIQVGVAAWATFVKFDESVAWLGIDEQGRGVVYKANGYNAMRISTQAIEAKIASATDFTDSYAYVYHEQGHIFYILKIKGLDADLVFDGNTNLWHERQWHNTTSGADEQHKASCHFFFAQKHLIGDRLTGNIYQQSLSIEDFNGEPRIWKRVTPHIQDEKKRLTFSSIEVDMEVGVGNSTGTGTDPLVGMRYSDDGGKTWSNMLFRTMGAQGEYKTRVRWARCGAARDRVFEFTGSEPVFTQLNGAYINAT